MVKVGEVAISAQHPPTDPVGTFQKNILLILDKIWNKNPEIHLLLKIIRNI